MSKNLIATELQESFAISYNFIMETKAIKPTTARKELLETLNGLISRFVMKK